MNRNVLFIGPILGVILTAAAMSESASAGIRLLGADSAGLGLPFLLAAVFLHELAGRCGSCGSSDGH